MKYLVLVIPLFLTGCSFLQSHGIIKAKGVTVAGVKDAGKPATLATSEAGSVLPLPEGTTFVTTKFEAIPATPKTAYVPARTVTEIKLAAPSELRTTESKVNADTGTVDTTTVTHKQDLAASAPLLYAAMACGAAAIFFLYRAYPTPAALCGAGSVICLVAWKVAQAPPMLWVGAAVAISAAVALYLGHERGLDKQPKPNPTP